MLKFSLLLNFCKNLIEDLKGGSLAPEAGKLKTNDKILENLEKILQDISEISQNWDSRLCKTVLMR